MPPLSPRISKAYSKRMPSPIGTNSPYISAAYSQSPIPPIWTNSPYISTVHSQSPIPPIGTRSLSKPHSRRMSMTAPGPTPSPIGTRSPSYTRGDVDGSLGTDLDLEGDRDEID